MCHAGASLAGRATGSGLYSLIDLVLVVGSADEERLSKWHATLLLNSSATIRAFNLLGLAHTLNDLCHPDVKEAAGRQRWTFLTNHTHVLVMLDKDEPPVLREVAVQVGITERAVQRIIQDLEEGGFVERERVGRRNRYRVVRDIRLRHPIESHRTIGDLLNLVQAER